MRNHSGLVLPILMLLAGSARADRFDVQMAEGDFSYYIVNRLLTPGQRSDFAIDLNGDKGPNVVIETHITNGKEVASLHQTLRIVDPEIPIDGSVFLAARAAAMMAAAARLPCKCELSHCDCFVVPRTMTRVKAMVFIYNEDHGTQLSVNSLGQVTDGATPI